jgi:hypothetical protein
VFFCAERVDNLGTYNIPVVRYGEVERPGQFSTSPIQRVELRAAAGIVPAHLLDDHFGIRVGGFKAEDGAGAKSKMGERTQASSVGDSGKRVCGRSQKAFVARGTAEDWGSAAGQVGEGAGASEEGGVESRPGRARYSRWRASLLVASQRLR